MDSACTLQSHLKYAVVRGKRARVRQRSGLGLGALAGLHDNAGLGVGYLFNNLEELLAVLEGLKIEYESVGVGVILKGCKQSVFTHHGLVTNGDEVRETDTLAGCPVHDGGAVCAGLGDEGNVTACRETVCERGVYVVESGDVAQAVRPEQVDAVIQALLSNALLELFLTYLCKTGGDDGDILGAIGHAGIYNGLRETSGHEDYYQIHRLRQRVYAGITGLAAQLLTGHLGVYTIKIPLVVSSNNVVEYNGAQLGGVSGYANHGNALRIEE